MNQVTDQQIIEILRKEAVPALGCTEPVACALACAKCKEVLGGVPERLDGRWHSGNRNGRVAYCCRFGSCLWKIGVRVGSVERGERGG